MEKKIYEVFEVNNKPKKNFDKSSTYRVYYNSLYMEAECNIECKLDIDVLNNISDEEFDKLVREELEEIIFTLESFGRYPEYGIPKYVMI